MGDRMSAMFFCIQDKTPCSIQDAFKVNAIVIHMLNILPAVLTLILTFNQLRLQNLLPFDGSCYPAP